MHASGRVSAGTAAALPILIVAVAAAAWTIAAATGMWTAARAMGHGPLAFTLMWAVMMAAMMLPSMTPVATRYLDVIERRRAVRGTLFVS